MTIPCFGQLPTWTSPYRELHENTWARFMMGLQIVGINYDTEEADTAAKDIVTRLHTFRTGEAFSPYDDELASCDPTALEPSAGRRESPPMTRP